MGPRVLNFARFSPVLPGLSEFTEFLSRPEIFQVFSPVFLQDPRDHPQNPQGGFQAPSAFPGLPRFFQGCQSPWAFSGVLKEPQDCCQSSQVFSAATRTVFRGLLRSPQEFPPASLHPKVLNFARSSPGSSRVVRVHRIPLQPEIFQAFSPVFLQDPRSLPQNPQDGFQAPSDFPGLPGFFQGCQSGVPREPQDCCQSSQVFSGATRTVFRVRRSSEKLTRISSGFPAPQGSQFCQVFPGFFQRCQSSTQNSSPGLEIFQVFFPGLFKGPQEPPLKS